MRCARVAYAGIILQGTCAWAPTYTLSPAKINFEQPMSMRPEFLLEAAKKGGGGGRAGASGLGDGNAVGEASEADEAARKEGKKYLPWSAYRKEQKKARRSAMAEDASERAREMDEMRRIESRRKHGLPDEDAIMPVCLVLAVRATQRARTRTCRRVLV